MSALFTLLKRDLRLANRQRSEWLTPVVFFILVTTLFPLAVSPESDTLRTLGPGVIWVAALLSTLLALPRLFGNELNDGTLEQLLLSPQPLSLLVLGKICAHWLGSGLPLVIIAPLLAIQLHLDMSSIGFVVVTLLLGTPSLSLIGAIGAALTLGLRGGGVLLSLLILPLYTPILIFGTGAVIAHGAGLATQGHLSLLGAYLLLSLVFAPWVTAQALRISLD
ncbi:MAG: heme exporter protein CcmB [Granulosicoccaceae bacterium]